MIDNLNLDSLMLNKLTNKERYSELCDERKDIPLFMQAWWMDAVCSSEKKVWDVFLVEQNGHVVGAMPYHIMSRFYLKIITQPQLTQYNGIWIDYPMNQSNCERLSFEKRIISKIVLEIKNSGTHFFIQNFHYSMTNWQPFYWLGYCQTTRYTYKLKNINNLDNIFNNFHIGKQKHIMRAQRNLHVDFDIEPTEFFNFHSNSLKIKKKSVFYSEDFFLNIYKSVMKRGQGKIIAIRDRQQNIHSAIFTVWDSNSAYYLVSAIDPRYKSSGASSLMVWEAIQFLSNKTFDFDFEGSMIEGVAKANEEFGAEQIPYSMIYKINPFFEILMNFQNRL